jgi:hypothetical protein
VRPLQKRGTGYQDLELSFTNVAWVGLEVSFHLAGSSRVRRASRFTAQH